MTEMAPRTLDDRLQSTDQDPLLVDIRQPTAFDEWHIQGSVNLDVADALADDDGDGRADIESLLQDREIVTVCAVGERSAETTAALRDEGYDAKTLRDGMRGWSRVHRRAEVPTTVAGSLVQIARPGTGCLSSVLVSDGDAAVFDPSIYLDEYEAILGDMDATLVGVFDTHAHADHVSGGPALAERYAVPYHLHPSDAVDREVTPLADGRVVAVGRVAVEVMHTPGHSPGSVSFGLEGEVLLTGDTLFHESVGRVELGVDAGLEDTDIEANAATLFESLQRLRSYGENPIVLPTHDPGSPDPPVTARMHDVATHNEGLRRNRDDFVAALADDVPDHPPNFERIKRVNVGADSLATDEPETLEQGPNNCAAE